MSQPVSRWRDDFDSGRPPWTTVTYGLGNEWRPGAETCVLSPGTPPVPARNFWFTGVTGSPGDCSVTPYTALRDGAIRSPRIDTGYSAPLLLALAWSQLLTLTPPPDGDRAEVWIDHDDDGSFTRVATFQGQVTTNGDVLDPATLDLTGLAGAGRFVTLELRFVSDSTGGGGSPLSLGWIVDDVELSWTDSQGRQCDQTTCASSPCIAAAALAAAPPQACVGQPVTLDAGASTAAGCPAPGTIAFQWHRDGVPIAGATGPTHAAVEPVPGTYTYRIDVSCSTDPACADSATHVLGVIVDGSPVAVGNGVRAARAGGDVALRWTDPQPFARSWNVYRSAVKDAAGTAVPAALPAWLDAGAVAPPPATWFYGVRARSCSGIEGP